MMESFFAISTIIFTIFAGIIAILNFFGITSKKETLGDRISKLTKALEESGNLVSEMEQEIKGRQELVTRLQNDAKHYEELKSINLEQANAVTQAFSGIVRKEGRKSFWQGMAMNFVYFLMGASVSYLLTVYF
jgi:hypothetical protein